MVEVKFGILKNYNKSMPEGVIPPASRIPPQTLTYYTALQPYAVVTVDLSVARLVLTSLGAMVLPDGTPVPKWIANTLSVTAITTGGTFSFALGDQFTTPGALGAVTGGLGVRSESIPFTSLFIANTAQVATIAELFLAWID